MIDITVSIILLHSTTSTSEFLEALQKSGSEPITIARVIQWIITPTHADGLLSNNWDFMVILGPGSTLSTTVHSLCAKVFSIQLQEADDFPKTYKDQNEAYLHPSEAPPPIVNLTGPHPLVATSAQHVELTPSLLAFARSELCPKGAVSMLNFIAYHPTSEAKESYCRYIEAFRAGVGRKRGGTLKLFGHTAGADSKGLWDEVAMAQYSTLEHFADMMADAEYQEANQRFRLGALKDTCILMTSEIDLNWTVQGAQDR